jgi:sec-independent protein translocase protein TatC
MSLAEHLVELRSRLVKCTLAVLALGGVSLIFARPIFGLLMQPVLAALPPDGRSLIYTSGIEEINVLMKVGVYCGIFLTTPVILWQIWGFVSPGLYPEERRYASPFVVFGSLAFIMGALFCYFAVLPSMFRFLLSREDTAVVEAQLETAQLRAEDALRFLRLGDAERAGQLVKEASAGMQVQSAGRVGQPEVVPAESVELAARLEGLGRLLDAAADGFGVSARAVLRQAVEKRVAAAEAFSRKDFAASAAAQD